MRYTHTMPPPRPLTRMPAPSLDFSRPGTPAADDFGDIYFSTDGGLEEARAVFLHGCGLPERWQGRAVFTIAELGFGSGLNFLAAWQSWRQSGAKGRLHFISVEGFPFERAALERALNHFPELADLACPLIDSWPGPVRGVHRRHFGDVTLTLVHDDVIPALASQAFETDAWFLDGFSPARNPAMWSPAVMAEVARLSAPDARLATFTVAGAVRRALGEAGFAVERREGFGRKRHRLEARLIGERRTRAAPLVPTIIGAGIAGASIAGAFRRRGLTPRVCHDPGHIAASGNGAALVKPRLDLQDNPASRFFLASYLYARHIYADAVRHEGLSHIAKTAKESERFHRIAAQEPLGPGGLVWTGEALAIPGAMVIDTEAAKTRLLDGIDVQARPLGALDDADGPLILACGYGIRALLPGSDYRFSRGQLSWTSGTLEAPVTYGGYAVPIRDRILIGATHDRLVKGEDPFTLRVGDDARNLAQAEARGLPVGPDTESHRASVRVTTADTLPRMGPIGLPDGRRAHILSGLGSRGFTFAPLLGEALVSDYLGEPGPLERGFAARIAP